jgi:hypothetical protein
MRYASINDQKWQNWTDDFMTKTRKVPMTKEQSENFLMCVMPEQRPDLLARFTEECERNGKGMFPSRCGTPTPSACRWTATRR